LEFLFTDKDTEGLTELYSSVRNSSFGDFVVDPNALQVVFVGKCIHNIFILLFTLTQWIEGPKERSFRLSIEPISYILGSCLNR
jgi:hypothetical protein